MGVIREYKALHTLHQSLLFYQLGIVDYSISIYYFCNVDTFAIQVVPGRGSTWTTLFGVGGESNEL